MVAQKQLSERTGDGFISPQMIANRHKSPSPMVKGNGPSHPIRQHSKHKHSRAKTISKERSDVSRYNSILQNKLNNREKIIKEFTGDTSSIHFAPKLEPIPPSKLPNPIII
jgi:hypothetical protein